VENEGGGIDHPDMASMIGDISILWFRGVRGRDWDHEYLVNVRMDLDFKSEFHILISCLSRRSSTTSLFQVITSVENKPF